MKKLLLAAISALLPSCVSQVSTTSKPIDGVVLSHTGSPVQGARVWACFSMPGGIVKPAKRVAMGPAISDSDGRFRIEMRPVRMTQTHSIFDGNPNPELIVVHKQLGAFGKMNMKNERVLPYTILRFSKPDPNVSIRGTFRIIDQLPPEEIDRAEAYLGAEVVTGSLPN